MSEKVTLDSHVAVEFPNCCATCLATEDLSAKSMTSGRVASVRPNLGGLTFSNELREMSYLVCPQHAKNSFWEYVYTRQTLGFKLFRGFMYLYGPMSCLLVILYLVTIPLGNSKSSFADKPMFFLVLIGFSAVSFVFLVKAMLTNAVKITSFGSKTITVKFRNEEYAHKFKLLNRKAVKY